MAVVETARGPVELDRLGQTLIHEHVFVENPVRYFRPAKGGAA